MKHVNFVSEPMGEKGVSELPMPATVAKRLSDQGFKHVSSISYVEKDILMAQVKNYLIIRF